MSRRFLPGLCALLAAAALVSPVHAYSHVVAQQSSKTTNMIFLRHGLFTGHEYRIDVSAPHQSKFVGYGTEEYTVVQSGRLLNGSKNLALSGTAPRSFTFKGTVAGRILSWTVAIYVRAVGLNPITVRLVDLGKHK